MLPHTLQEPGHIYMQVNGKKDQYDANDAKLRGIISEQRAFEQQLFLCAKNKFY